LIFGGMHLVGAAVARVFDSGFSVVEQLISKRVKMSISVVFIS
jgi:hypothetical protein